MNEKLGDDNQYSHKERIRERLGEAKGRVDFDDLIFVRDDHDLYSRSLLRIMETQGAHPVISKLSEIDKSFHLDIAIKMIEMGETALLFQELDKFRLAESGLNADPYLEHLAQKLMEKGQEEYIARRLERFKTVNHQELIDKLLAVGKGRVVADNFFKFKIDLIALVNQLIEAGELSAISHAWESHMSELQTDTRKQIEGILRSKGVKFYWDKKE